MNRIFLFLRGPTIHQYFSNGRWQSYQAGLLESISESCIRWIESIGAIYLMFIPYYAAYQPLSNGFGQQLVTRYRQFVTQHVQLGAIIVLVYAACVLTRSASRYNNTLYHRYINTFSQMDGFTRRQVLEQKRKWDIDFKHWNVDFTSPKSQINLIKGDGCGLYTPICYMIGHSFARWMIFPGATPLLNAILKGMLTTERQKMIDSGAQRAKLQSCLGDHIDTLFYDRRAGINDRDGATLIITSEGNAGFMEVGSFSTVAKSSFSVLGYNHPGFGGSTGQPYPENNAAAIQSVVEYATHELGFLHSDIIIYAWSIGGFDAAYAGSKFPDLKGLYLDATFDDVMPLAEHVMPPAIKAITSRTIRNIWNLNNAEYLTKFNGPVTILRRNRDEIMQQDPRNVSQNRANTLLVEFLRSRYPYLMTDKGEKMLTQYLALSTEATLVSWMVQHQERSIAQSVIESWSGQDKIPSNDLGKDLDEEIKLNLLLYLVDKHFLTFDAGHGTPLPVELLDIPWKI